MDILDTAPFHDCFETVLHGTRLNIAGFISSQYISLLYSLLNQFFTQRTCYRDISDGALALRLCNQNRSFPFTIRCLYALHRPVNMDHIVFKRNIIPVVDHERVNGSAGSFERSVQGLRCLQSNGFHVTVKHCITKENYKDLVDFYNFVENTFPQDVDMQICSIDYCGLADDTKYDYMVVFPDLEPYFEKMFDQYMADIDSGSVRHVYCINMPLCSMDPYYWDFVAPKAKAYGKYAAPTSTGESDVMAGEESFLGTFGKACERCKVEMICAGTYRTAFNYFGDKIIKPYE